MFRNWLPGVCSRLSIFVSYSSDDSQLAESIAQTLKNSGHKVFFDKDSLPPAGDYNERIRRAIRTSDRFLFLASRSALDKGKYTLTELDFAQKRWPSPVGRVFPVLVDRELEPAALPAYLSSVQAINIAGNAPAEIAATLERTSKVSTACRACLTLLTLALAGVIGLATGRIPISTGYQPPQITLVAPEFVHFRPRARPPDNPGAPGADTSWATSPVTVTLPIAYSSGNAGSAPVQLISEEVEVELGDRKEKYTWTYVVEIVSGSIADTHCAEWLCQKGPVRTENIRPGETTGTRETMFLPAGGSPLTWRQLIDPVLAANGPAMAKVTLRSRLVVADGSAKKDLTRERECVLDVAGARQRMLIAGFRPAQDPRPPTWQPRCVQNDGR